MKAVLSNYRQAPRKTRAVADLIRGKSVAEARTILAHTPKRASRAFTKLIESAVANARHNNKAQVESLYIETLTVNEGETLHRFLPVARGSAHPLRKRASHITLELGIREKSETKKEKATAQ